MRNALLIGLSACVVWTTPSSAQTETDASWTWSVQLSAGVAVKTTDWSISHPTYSGGGVTWETFTGTFTHRLQLMAGVELRKRYLGLRGTFGVLPQRFKEDAPAQDKDLKLLLAGLAAVLYPTAGTEGSWEPYVTLGGGGQKATGDMDIGGFYLSSTVGVKKDLTARVALDGGVQIQRLKYTQIEVGNRIAKDVRTHPLSVFLGARIGG
jgi:hypothetical protein